MRQSLGTAVFGGMLGVTGFGLMFTPAFYTLVQRIGTGQRRASANHHKVGTRLNGRKT
jgi:hypothetical protein